MLSRPWICQPDGLRVYQQYHQSLCECGS